MLNILPHCIWTSLASRSTKMQARQREREYIHCWWGVVKILLCFGPKGSYFNCLITGCCRAAWSRSVFQDFLFLFIFSSSFFAFYTLFSEALSIPRSEAAYHCIAYHMHCTLHFASCCCIQFWNLFWKCMRLTRRKCMPNKNSIRNCQKKGRRDDRLRES